MKKDEFLLAQNNKRRVDEIDQFTHAEQNNPTTRHAKLVIGNTHRVIESLSGERSKEIGQKSSSADDTENSENDIPGDERVIEVESLSRLHELLTSVNGQHIQDRVVEGKMPVVLEPANLSVSALDVEELLLEEEHERLVACLYVVRVRECASDVVHIVVHFGGDRFVVLFASSRTLFKPLFLSLSN